MMPWERASKAAGKASRDAHGTHAQHKEWLQRFLAAHTGESFTVGMLVSEAGRDLIGCSLGRWHRRTQYKFQMILGRLRKAGLVAARHPARGDTQWTWKGRAGQ